MSVLSGGERVLAGIARFGSYVVCRLGERSTWTSIGVGVTAAALLEAPWSYVFLTISVIGVLVPDGNLRPE